MYPTRRTAAMHNPASCDRPGDPGPSLTARSVLALVGTLAALTAGPAWAGVPGGADTVAQGGTTIANPEDNAPITDSPGLLPLTQRYDVQGDFDIGPTGNLLWGGSIVDSRTTKVGFGLGYHGDSGEFPIATQDLPGWQIVGEDLPTGRTDHRIELAAGIPLFDHRLGVGIGGDVVIWHRETDEAGTDGQIDFGAGALPLKWLVVSGVARNLLPLTGAYARDLEAGGGLRLFSDRYGAVTGEVVYTTAEIDDGASPLTIAAGGQVCFGDGRIRAGWRSEGPTDSQAFTWGLGAQNESGGFSYGMVVPLGAPLEFASLTHAITIRFHLPDPWDESDGLDDQSW